MKNPFERVSLRPGLGETINLNIYEPYTVSLTGHSFSSSSFLRTAVDEGGRIKFSETSSDGKDTPVDRSTEIIIPELWTNIPCLNDSLLDSYFRGNYTNLYDSLMSDTSSLAVDGDSKTPRPWYGIVTSTLMNNPNFSQNNNPSNVEFRIPIIPLLSGRYEYTGRIRYVSYEKIKKDTENSCTDCTVSSFPSTTSGVSSSVASSPENTVWAGGYGSNTVINVTNTIGTTIYNAGATNIYLHHTLSTSSATENLVSPSSSSSPSASVGSCPFRTSLLRYILYYYPRIVECILRYRQYQDNASDYRSNRVVSSLSTPTGGTNPSVVPSSSSHTTIPLSLNHHRYDSDRLCAYVLTLMVSELALRGETDDVCMDLVDLALSLPSTQQQAMHNPHPHPSSRQLGRSQYHPGHPSTTNSLPLSSHYPSDLQTVEHTHTHSLPDSSSSSVASFVTPSPSLPIVGWFTSRSSLTKLLRRYVGDIASQRAAQALWGIPFPSYMYALPLRKRSNDSDPFFSTFGTEKSSSEETVIIHDDNDRSFGPSSVMFPATVLPDTRNRTYEQSLALRQRLLSALLEWSIGIETPSLRRSIIQGLGYGNPTNTVVHADPSDSATLLPLSLAVCMPTDIIGLEFLLGILRLGEWAYVSSTFLDIVVYVMQIPSLPFAASYSSPLAFDHQGFSSISSNNGLHGTVQRTWIQHILNALYMPFSCPLPLTYYDTTNVILAEVHGIPVDGTGTSSAQPVGSLMRSVSVDDKNFVRNEGFSSFAFFASPLSLSAVSVTKLRGSQPVLRLRRAIISALAVSLLRKVRTTAIQTVSAVSRERELPSLEVSTGNDNVNANWTENSTSKGNGAPRSNSNDHSSTNTNSSTTTNPRRNPENESVSSGSVTATSTTSGSMSTTAIQFLGTGPRSPDRHRGQLPSAAKRSASIILPVPHAPSIEGSSAGPDIVWQRVDTYGLPIITKPVSKPSNEPEVATITKLPLVSNGKSSSSSRTNKKDNDETDGLSSSEPSANSGHHSSSGSGSGSSSSSSGSETVSTSSSQNPRNSSPPSPLSSNPSSSTVHVPPPRYGSPYNRSSSSNRNHRNMSMLSSRPIPGSISPRPSDAAESLARTRAGFHSSYSKVSPDNTYEISRKLVLTDNDDTAMSYTSPNSSTSPRLSTTTLYSINDPDVYGTNVSVPRIGSTGSLLTSDFGTRLRIQTDSLSSRTVSPWNNHSDAKYAERTQIDDVTISSLPRSTRTSPTAKPPSTVTDNLTQKGTLRDVLAFIVSIVKEFPADAYGDLPQDKETVPLPVLHSSTEKRNSNVVGSSNSSVVDSPIVTKITHPMDTLRPQSSSSDLSSTPSTVTEVPVDSDPFAIEKFTTVSPVNPSFGIKHAAAVPLPLSSLSIEDHGTYHNSNLSATIHAPSNGTMFSPVVPHPPFPLSNLSITLPLKKLSNPSLSSGSMQSIVVNDSPVMSPKAHRATPTAGSMNGLGGRIVASSPSGPRSIGSTPIADHDSPNVGKAVAIHIVSPSDRSSSRSGSVSLSPLGLTMPPAVSITGVTIDAMDHSLNVDLTSTDVTDRTCADKNNTVSSSTVIALSPPSSVSKSSSARISAFRTRASPHTNTTPYLSFLQKNSSSDEDDEMERSKKGSLSLSSNSTETGNGIRPLSLSGNDIPTSPYLSSTNNGNDTRNRSSSIVSSISTLSSVFDKEKDGTLNDSMFQRNDTALSVFLSALQSTLIGAIGPCRLITAVGHILTRLSQLLCNEYDQILRQAILLAQADEGVARYLTARVLNSWPRSDSDKEKAMLQFIGSTISTWIGDVRRPGGSCMDIDSKRNNVHLPKCIDLFKRVSKRISICIKSPHHAVAYEAILICLPKPIPWMTPAFHHRMLPPNHLPLSFGQRTVMEPSVLVCIVRALEENAGVKAHASNSFFSRPLLSPVYPSIDTVPSSSFTASLASPTDTDPLSSLPVLAVRTSKSSRSTSRRYGSYSGKGSSKTETLTGTGKGLSSENELSPSLKRHDSESSLDSLDSYGSMDSENGDTPTTESDDRNSSTDSTKEDEGTVAPLLTIVHDQYDNVEDADGEYSESSSSSFSSSSMYNLSNKHPVRMRTALPVRPSSASAPSSPSVTEVTGFPKRTVASSSNRSDAYSRIIENIIHTLKAEELESTISSRIPSMTRHLSLASNSSISFPLAKSLSFSTKETTATGNAPNERSSVDNYTASSTTPRLPHKPDHRKEERKARRILLALWGLSEAINRVSEVRLTDNVTRPPSRSSHSNDFPHTNVHSPVPSSPLRSNGSKGSSNGHRIDYSRDPSFSPTFGSASFVYPRTGSPSYPASSSPPPTMVSPSINAYKGSGHWSSNIRGNSFIALQQLQAFVKEKYSVTPNDLTNPEVVQTLRQTVERKRNKRRDTSTGNTIPSETITKQRTGSTVSDPRSDKGIVYTVTSPHSPSVRERTTESSLIVPNLSLTFDGIDTTSSRSSNNYTVPSSVSLRSSTKTEGTSGDRNVIVVDTSIGITLPKVSMHNNSSVLPFVTNPPMMFSSDTSSPNIPSSPYDSPLDSPTSPNHTTHTPNIRNVSSNYTSNILPFHRGTDMPYPGNMVSVSHPYGSNSSYPSSLSGRRSTHGMNPNNIGRASPALAQALGLSASTGSESVTSGVGPNILSYVATGSGYATSPIPTYLPSQNSTAILPTNTNNNNNNVLTLISSSTVSPTNTNSFDN